MESLKNNLLKSCNTCKDLKPLSEFYKSKANKYGIDNSCKSCKKSYALNYGRTEIGVIIGIYSRQKINSRKRNHPLPSYSKSELKEWMYNEGFKLLYDNWLASDFSKWLKPSCDRLDDYKGYSFDNMRLVTWKENDDKANEDVRNGILRKTFAPVLQFTKEGVFIKSFKNILSAKLELGIDSSSISRTCKGKQKTAGDFVWKYAKINKDVLL